MCIRALAFLRKCVCAFVSASYISFIQRPLFWGPDRCFKWLIFWGQASCYRQPTFWSQPFATNDRRSEASPLLPMTVVLRPARCYRRPSFWGPVCRYRRPTFWGPTCSIAGVCCYSLAILRFIRRIYFFVGLFCTQRKSGFIITHQYESAVICTVS